MKLTTIRRTALTLTAVLFLFYASAAAEVSTSVDSSMAYLEKLADPATFQGRKTGQDGGQRAQEWIAAQFQRWGLQPLIGDNLLFPFPMLATNDIRTEISLVDDPRYGDLELRLGEDFTACTNSGSASLTAPVTLVGHGISKPGKNWDDYADLDITGKIVIIFRGEPDHEHNWIVENSRTYLFNEAVERGAVAVLFYQGSWAINGAAINVEAYHPDVPVGYISESAVRILLTGSGETVDSYKTKLKTKPLALELDRSMKVDFLVEKSEPGIGYDVVGVVLGTDEKLAKEAVIIGGHSDHAGPNANGVIYAGADDNGSGASTVMEMARVFAQNPQPRTLVFCLFGGEEQGLLGSRALAPEIPDDYTYVNMVNLDMVGRGKGLTGFGGGDQVAEVWNDWYDSLADSLKDQIRPSRAWGGSASDHAPFRDVGVPAFTLWSYGEHQFYHRSDDLFFTIEKPAMKSTLVTTAAWIQVIASYPDSFDKKNLSARTVWHQGLPFNIIRAENTAEETVTTLTTRVNSGMLGTVLVLGEGCTHSVADEVAKRIDGLRDAIEDSPRLSIATSIKNLRSNSRSVVGSVFPAITLNDAATIDSTSLPKMLGHGVSWVNLTPDFVNNDGLSNTFIRIVNGSDAVLSLPLNTAEYALDSIEKITGNVILIGDWKHFSTLSDESLDKLIGAGARFELEVPSKLLKKAAKESERIAKYKVHLQPPAGSYDESLEWVNAARKAKIEDVTLVEWLSGNISLW